MRKRGLSGVVTIVLMLLIVVSGISLIWVSLNKFLVTETEIATIKTELLGENIKITEVEFIDDGEFVLFTLTKLSDSQGRDSRTLGQSPEIEDLDVVSVFDKSGSMLEDGKIIAAKNANVELIRALFDSEGSERIGFVPYYGVVNPEEVIDLTNDEALLVNAIANLELGDATCTCCGIKAAVDLLRVQSETDRNKALIVMSDGKSTRGCSGASDNNIARTEAIIEAANAKAEFISAKGESMLSIYAVGFGEIVDGEIEDADEESLRKIADRGQYYQADVDSIISVYRDISRQLENFDTTLDFVRIVYYNKTDSYSETYQNFPFRAFESRNYQIELTDKIYNVDKIEIYPGALTESGDEIIGQRLDVWEK
jgi:hypothetical protein